MENLILIIAKPCTERNSVEEASCGRQLFLAWLLYKNCPFAEMQSKFCIFTIQGPFERLVD